MTITIRQAYDAQHWHAIVEHHGREYRASYADQPTREKVAADFQRDRSDKRLDRWK